MKAVLDHIGIAVEDRQGAGLLQGRARPGSRSAGGGPDRTCQSAQRPRGWSVLEFLGDRSGLRHCDLHQQAGARHPHVTLRVDEPSCHAGATQRSRRSARQLRAASGCRWFARRVYPPVCGSRRPRRTETACRLRREARGQPHLRRPPTDRATTVPSGWMAARCSPSFRARCGRS